MWTYEALLRKFNTRRSGCLYKPYRANYGWLRIVQEKSGDLLIGGRTWDRKNNRYHDTEVIAYLRISPNNVTTLLVDLDGGDIGLRRLLDEFLPWGHRASACGRDKLTGVRQGCVTGHSSRNHTVGPYKVALKKGLQIYSDPRLGNNLITGLSLTKTKLPRGVAMRINRVAAECADIGYVPAKLSYSPDDARNHWTLRSEFCQLPKHIPETDEEKVRIGELGALPHLYTHRYDYRERRVIRSPVPPDVAKAHAAKFIANHLRTNAVFHITTPVLA